MKYKDLESSILHTFASDMDLFVPCENLAFEDIWQDNHNKVIFKIIKDNHAKKVKTDLHLLKNGLLKAGYEKTEIRSILEGFHNSDSSIKSNIAEHMNIVFEVYSRRKMKPIFHKAFIEIFSNNGDIDENVNKVKDIFNELDIVKNNISIEKSIMDVFETTLKEFEDAQSNKKEIIGYSTGLKELDKVTCGLKQEVIVVGAAPGMGKSTFMVNTAINTAIKDNNPTMIFSLEMSAQQLMRNIWANYYRINSWQIRSGNADAENADKIRSFKSKLNSNLVIDDTSGITAQYIETKIRIMRRTIPLNITIVVIVDYLQRMNNIKEEYLGMNEERQIHVRCKRLADISKVYNVCMIELSQLSRECIKNKRRATPSDLLGGGGIEQAADQIWMLFRADYYEKEPKDEMGTDLRGVVEIDIVKNRYGETKPLYASFYGKYSALEDYDKDKKSEEVKADEEAF